MKKSKIERKMITMPKTFRNVTIRISALNHATKDNEILGIKAGDEVRYTIKDILNVLEDWSDKKDIKYYAIEHNEDPDNIHYHVVISFPKDSVCIFETLKNKFPYGDIEGCKYGVKSCVQYLIHMNHPEKFQYDWSDVVTNAPDKLEDYKIPGKATMNAKLKNTLDKIIKGEIKEYEIDKIDYEIFLKYRRQIMSAFEYRQKTVALNKNRNFQVIVLQGPPRVGKSTFCKVYAQKHNKSICFSSSSNDPWQDYAGQDIFVYDDFNYTRNKIEDLLKAFDPHNLTSVSARYKNKLFTGDTIFICTNTKIENWYTWATDVHRKALFKRISCVLDFKDITDGTTEYTVNNIVGTGVYNYPEDSEGNMNFDDSRKYEMMTLDCRDNMVHTFVLKYYININEDTDKVEEFINQLNDI